jgi:hypothetical protein
MLLKESADKIEAISDPVCQARVRREEKACGVYPTAAHNVMSAACATPGASKGSQMHRLNETSAGVNIEFQCIGMEDHA